MISTKEQKKIINHFIEQDNLKMFEGGGYLWKVINTSQREEESKVAHDGDCYYDKNTGEFLIFYSKTGFA